MPEPWGLRYPGVDVKFTDASGIYLRVTPDIADYDIADGDVDSARADGTQVGMDFHHGRTIGVTFGILGSSEAEMWDRFNQLASYWNAAAVRSAPGALAELVSPRGRSAFGRPRKISPSDVSPEAKMMTVQTTFRQVDKLWYGAPDQLTVPFAISQGGGLVAPLKEPLVARGYTTRANTFTVAGSEPTPFVATIRGAILNPGIEIAGVAKYAAQTSLAYDETLTIDTRPGRMSVLRNGTKIASLTRNSDLLTDGVLSPGPGSLTLTGSSSTGNPTATLMWRSATLAP
ncbi:hypothetical protein HUN59_14860 [Curtobacterium sp. Csp2]|uniref:hypothetical protein n=1 Tax=Curtobacterium sp. Csp2 TaxID=2495430 RepID=UPI001580E5E4|nr:hypothetical protein [Curtobacterium sp. Csp2]QKS14795.1 hypothetical protein HUN59_14860 [Curtobacterium sp. Csp2]